MSKQSRVCRAVYLAAGLAVAAAAHATRVPVAPESAFDPALMQVDEPRYLGAGVRRDLMFLDASGAPFALEDMLGKPLILVLSYFSCDGTCPTVNRSLQHAAARLERFRIGRDFRVLTVSFDQHDTPANAAHFAQHAGAAPGSQAGWRHAVLRQPETDIAALTESVGFRFFWSRADRTFVHPNVLVFITPQGRIARYLYGTSLDKKTLELALIDADWERIANSANVIDLLTGVCYSYNFVEGRYQLNYALLAGAGSLALGVLAIAGGFLAYRRRLRRLSHAS